MMALIHYHKKKGFSRDRYIVIPRQVALHTDYLSLSGAGVKVLNYLLTKYNSKNNGDLSLPKSESPKIKLSHPTLTKALRELQRKEFITKTRQGTFSRHGAQCALYAINWLPMNEINK